MILIALPCTGAIGGTATATAAVCVTTATTFTVSGASSGAGISYQWMVSGTAGGPYVNVTGGTGANTVSYTIPTDLAVGTYYYVLQVTCSAGPINANSNEITLTVKPTPTATASNSGPVCSGSSLTLTGTTDITTGTTFSWSGSLSYSSTSQSPTFNVAVGGGGTYTFTATLNGCSSSGTTTVVVNETPSAITITPASATICEGSVQELTATGGTLTAESALYTENFNGVTNSWTTINNSTGGTPSAAAWTLRNSGYLYSTTTYSSTDNSQFYMSNSDAQGSGSTTATILQSPVISTSGYTVANLKFNHYYQHWSSGGSIGSVQASTDGTNWTTLQTYTATTGSSTAFASASVALTAPFLNQPAVYVRFKFDVGYGYSWNIDNVAITTPVSAAITWSPVTDLYTDAAATNAYAGESLTTVYAKPSSSLSYAAVATNAGCATTPASTNLIVSPLPAGASITGTTAVCEGATQPVITFTANVGTAPYTFTYTINGGTNQTVVSAGGTNPVSVTVPVPTTAAGTYVYNLVSVADIYCSNTASGSATVTVNPLPVVSFTGLSGPYCVNAAAVTLTGSPAGGTFSGAGVSGNTFDPATAGAGTHSVTYTYSDGTCSNTATQSVTVNALPVVSFTGLAASYCAGAPSVTLSGTPTGGTFSGPGITGDVFDPSAAGVGGPYTITYSFTDGNGCTNSTSQTVTVNSAPVVSFTGLASDYCSTAGAVTLTGSPAGGTFSGPGVTGNTFDPSVAGAGLHTITYSYTDGNGCSASTSQQTTVTVCATFATLNLKAFLEGFYVDINTMRPTIYDLGISTDPTETDTITVNLWSAGSLANAEPDHSVKAVLHTDGTTTMQFPAAVNGNAWYIAVKHRNTIETWSANPVTFTASTSYDFTTGLGQAYNDGFNPPMKPLAGGVYGMYSGDVNQDGTVDLSDAIEVQDNGFLFAYGYDTTDTNGDGATDLSDAIIVQDNGFLFLFYARPY
jgi:hypothetical protein